VKLPQIQLLIPHFQQYRRYATEPSSGGSNVLLYAAVAAAAGGVGYYFYSQGDNAAKVKGAAKDAEAKAKGIAGGSFGSSGASKAFIGGDQGFISLKLDSVENINHNTKKFRFELPESDQVSGLTVASALITKYKGPEMAKAAIRPYTPVNDECKNRSALNHFVTNIRQLRRGSLIFWSRNILMELCQHTCTTWSPASDLTSRDLSPSTSGLLTSTPILP